MTNPFAIELKQRILHISEVCKEIMPVPAEAILFGMGMDKLPVLFSVRDTVSPNTMIWDRIIGQGLRLIKTAIDFILHYKDQSHYPTEFVIISNNTSEWLKLSENELGVWSKNECIAVVPFWDKVADQVIFALSGWCVASRGTKMPLLVFIDGFENILRMGEEAQHNLQAVMSYGRKRNIYIIATANSKSRELLSRWLEFFQAEMYGQEQLEYFEMSDHKKSVIFWTPEVGI